ncbi:recombinase family protein [Rhizobium sp. P32RR-XVIII]|uniref:recombinase family protein n=1 Tax=Rhizobium sp. P32RR-XVIII TaxID=2726738 RepID=UPI001456805D|nr:recombinase family protein [Rhizobium sp. P32RR-XVIII]NLS01997.1 recombinase family protein [Rhizobium sp. P32RR-XVIII]
MDILNRPKAYSYVRFSTPEQSKGDSFRRQTQAAEVYAATHGLEIDTKFAFHDLGMSAWEGRNKTDGMLGEFLSYVRSGDIAPGSYLLVENLDRVSRENALDALDTLKDIAREGVTVVTLNDGREYTYDSLRRNPIDLMVAVMMFMRANEESEVKARRLREAWGAKRKAAAIRPLSALSPGWLRLRDDRSGFDVIPERAEIVRRVFDMTLAGKGQHGIAETLNREGVPVFGRGKHWQRSYIKKMLADPSVVGNFTPHRVDRVDGKKVRTPTETVEGYFPAVIDREIFDRVSSFTNMRAATSKAPMANILAGLAKCPKCDATMTRVNKGGKKGGKPYLVCTVAKAGAGCEYRQVRLDDVEAALLAKAPELLIALPAPDMELQTEWERISLHDEVIGDEIQRLVEAIAAVGHSKALLDRLKDMEAERDGIRRRLGEIEGRISDALTNRVMNTTTELVDASEKEHPDIPMINAILRQLFEKVTVDWPNGQVRFHWKHAPEETTGVTYAWPKEE